MGEVSAKAFARRVGHIAKLQNSSASHRLIYPRGFSWSLCCGTLVPAVLADATATALRAVALPPAVLMDRAAAALLATVPSPSFLAKAAAAALPAS